LAIEQELRSARELQRVLIPETHQSLPGLAVTSAYLPAAEVGGDFFQLVPAEWDRSGSTLVVVGDVSGKGLKAAMSVALIVGAIRTLAEGTSSPADILAGVNRRVCGRLQGGFVTCLVLRLDPDGGCTVANAGHPPPFLNSEEMDTPGALPLGLISAITYDEMRFQLHPRDHMTLYTDGLLEARNHSGELYGFERMYRLLASRPTAGEAARVAVDFGQDDDITVLTLTRL
jgi:serine phosphatase RsbU (regulator of sigma subunit)